MAGRESTHREEDLYKLAYRVSPHPDKDLTRNDEVRPSAGLAKATTYWESLSLQISFMTVIAGIRLLWKF